MKTLTFDVTIQAPRADVWTAMLGPETYKVWTAAFCEGSSYEGSWDQGATIRFLAPSGDGMVSEIAENRPQTFVSIRHVGMIEQGVEDRSSDKVKAWAPAFENYGFADVPGGCQVTVSVDTAPEWEDFMRETFPKALGLLKAYCEREAAG